MKERAVGSGRTSVEMSLLRELIIRVTVRIDGPVHLLEGHERMDESVVGV